MRPTGSILRPLEAAISRKRPWLPLRLDRTCCASALKRAVISAFGSYLVCFIDTSCVMTFRWIVLLLDGHDKALRRMVLEAQFLIPRHGACCWVFDFDFFEFE